MGKPLKDWDIKINFGIKTGFNEAFIIDTVKRNELIEKCPEADSIIRPILRGRDIQKYKAEWAGLYIIATLPSRKINIHDYPSIGEHLLSFGYDRLKQSGDIGARKKTHNQWFEMQDSISYWEDFTKQKIVWGEISDKSKFALDSNCFYTEATTFLLTGDNLKYLLAMLNSKLLEWYFNQLGTATGVGTNRWKKYTIEKLPIAMPSEFENRMISGLVDELMNEEILDEIRYLIEEKINNVIYEQYGLSEYEILYIKSIKI